MGKVATSPLPPEGSPPLQSGGTESELAHKWARWLHYPCRLGGSHRFRAGGRIRSGPQVGKVATTPLPPRGSPPLQSGGQNQNWPTSGQGAYITPAASGVPTASERGDRIGSGPQVGKVATSPLPPGGGGGEATLPSGGTESEVAHKWARWLQHPCRLGDPHRFRAGGRIRIGRLVGKVATSPLPPRRSPPLQSGGQNPKWPTSWQGSYITPAAWGVPTASKRGAESEVADKWARWLHHACRLGGGRQRFRAGGQNQKWPTSGQGGYITPAAWGVPTASERGDSIRIGPQVGKVATSPLPPRGSRSPPI